MAKLCHLLAIAVFTLGSATASPYNTLQKRQATEDGKAGLAWANADSVDMDQFKTDKVSWYYTWSVWPTDEGRNLEFVPLMWGDKSVTEWERNVNGILRSRFESGSIKNVLGFNEPQDPGQANISPSHAKELWMEHLVPLKETYGVRLGSPGTSSAPSGKTWTQEFLEECGDDCQVDFIALHWYGTNATEFIRYIVDFHDTFQLPIWVTEWACHDFVGITGQCDQDQVWEFMSTTQGFMDDMDWVERYAWFGAMPEPVVHWTNSIMDDDGDINDLGRLYIGGEGVPNGDSNGGGGGNSGGTGDWLRIHSSSCPLRPPFVRFNALGRVTFSLGVTLFIGVLLYY